MPRYWAAIAVMLHADDEEDAYFQANAIMLALNERPNTLAVIGDDHGDGYLELIEEPIEGSDEPAID